MGVAPGLEASSPKRLDELDSLRGLAALSVVLSHFVESWRDDAMLHSSHLSREVFTYLVYPVSAGREAVILFFVLSGFVLSIPAINSRAQTYPVFVVRRLFRIYMPYLVALTLAVLAAMIFHGNKTQSPWLNGPWSAPITSQLILQHLAFIGQYNAGQFDPPIWSLIYEMRISLVFPLLCAISLKLRPGWSLITAVFLSAVSILLNSFLTVQESAPGVIDTLHYAALFVVGIYLARQKNIISAVYKRMPRDKKVAIGILSALLYVYAGVIWQGIARRLTNFGLFNSADWLTALGAAGLIVLSLDSPLCRRVLLWRPIHALGKMSYSLYLLHFIVMLIAVHLFYGRLPLLVIFAISLPVALASSWAFYRLVEIPFINLGRRLSGHFNKQAVAVSARM